jgi:NitT/TauT family transport system substrate-binding protein
MIQRRRFLGTLGTAASVGVAGCTSTLSGSSLDELRLAYLPIYPNMQYFVMQQEGYLDDVPTAVTAK